MTPEDVRRLQDELAGMNDCVLGAEGSSLLIPTGPEFYCEGDDLVDMYITAFELDEELARMGSTGRPVDEPLPQDIGAVLAGGDYAILEPDKGDYRMPQSLEMATQTLNNY